ncbi:hypothetical protein [Bacterioplanoides sp.]|uniref:hypothetical protein n=1 Tax=Bacterioplanoides sp. TaxID=2066072 RepID=UPI003B591050
MNIEEFVQKAIREDISITDIESYSKSSSTDIESAFNKLSLHFAEKFNEGSISYTDCDFAMNGIWPIMLDYIMEKDIPLLEPCYEIYCAFDAGEYNHGDDADPVEKYTLPAIKEILENA